MLVLALGSFGLVGVGLSAECVTTFKFEVVSFGAAASVLLPLDVGAWDGVRVAPLRDGAGNPCDAFAGVSFSIMVLIDYIWKVVEA